MDKVSPACNLEFVREDDFVEYYIFPQLPDNLGVEDKQDDQLRQHLEEIRLQCLAVVERHVKQREYIWHKDEFQLQVRTVTAQERLLDDEHVTHNDSKVPLPPHLHGVTHFGDNIADEWFIVHLLIELTRELPHCVGRIVDADGEFMLIEAADVLPKWANPDTCEQRVYIADGHLQLVQNSPSNTLTVLSVATALNKLHLNPTLYRVSNEIQECINERLREFRESQTTAVESNSSIHRQIVRLPIGVAALLKQRPALIAPAVRAFCERDTIDMKACRAMCFFPPEQRVRTNVRFTRCLYAMAMHSNYVPDRKIGWNLSGATNTETYKEDLLGIKIACGFEILASQAKDVHNVENEPAWRAYVKSLTSKGYFRGNIEGSQDYQQLYKQAREYYTKNNERFRTAPLVGREILELLRSIEINAEQFRDEEQNNLQPSDSDDWLNISAEQLDAMLSERFGAKKLYKSNGDINAEEFTKNLSEFLEKQSEFDGIGDVRDSDDDEDDDDDDSDEPSSSSKQRRTAANIKKNRSMRKACNDHPITRKSENNDASCSDNFSTHVKNLLDFVIPEDNWDSNSEMSDYEDEDDLERNIEEMTNSELNIDADIKAYMAQMDKELARTTIGQTFEKQRQQQQQRRQSKSTTQSSAAQLEDDFDDIESFQPININVNTLKNMMDSYKSQIGGSGPASNLLNAMGFGMSHAAEDEKDLSESAV